MLAGSGASSCSLPAWARSALNEGTWAQLSDCPTPNTPQEAHFLLALLQKIESGPAWYTWLGNQIMDPLY